MKTLAATLLLMVVGSGCVSYQHQHSNVDGSKDTTTFTSFLMMGGASKIRSATKESTNYSRTVSIGSVEGKGDSDMVEAIAAGASRGAVEGLKKSQGIP